jgi:hypothetical protein
LACWLCWARDVAGAATTTRRMSPPQFLWVTTAGPTAFLAEARALPFGIKDLAAASDGDLLRLGRVVCDGLGIEGLGFSRVVQRLVRSEARPTTTEARAFVRTSVRNLCPEQASAIPS